ncbi:hypothetical protein ACTGU3_12515, partial [Streptococcus suis]
KRVAESPLLRHVPVVLYSILDSARLRAEEKEVLQGVTFEHERKAESIDSLVELIVSLVEQTERREA